MEVVEVFVYHCVGFSELSDFSDDCLLEFVEAFFDSF